MNTTSLTLAELLEDLVRAVQALTLAEFLGTAGPEERRRVEEAISTIQKVFVRMTGKAGQR